MPQPACNENNYNIKSEIIMKKFTITILKKQLAEKSKEDLINEISNLCKKFPQVKDYFKAQSGNIRDILRKHEDIIEKEFVEGKTRGLPKTRFSIARKAVMDFKKLTDDADLIAEIMFTYVESISSFNNEFCPDEERFYIAPEKMYEDALKLLNKNGLLDKFKERAYDIVANAPDDWGNKDSFQEEYEKFYGDFVD